MRAKKQWLYTRSLQAAAEGGIMPHRTRLCIICHSIGPIAMWICRHVAACVNTLLDSQLMHFTAKVTLT